MKFINKKLSNIVILFSLILDQSTKIIIRNNLSPGEHWPQNWEIIRFSHIRNTGAIFGTMQNMNNVLLIFSIIIIVLLIIYILSLTAINNNESISFGLIVGGGIGNICDRIFVGSVTDFIDPIYYPAFNFADSSIVIGIALYIYFALKEKKYDKKN